MTNGAEIPQEILDRHASWSRISIRLSTFQYTVGIIGVACGALAAAIGGEYGRVLAAGSGICTAVLGFVRPEQRYLRFIAAWRLLDIAILKFKLQQCDVAALVAAVEQGEAVLAEQAVKPQSLRPKVAERTRP